MTITADVADISSLRSELDMLDAQILAAVRERVDLTRRVGLEAGASRLPHHTEMGVLRRFEDELGRDGVSLGMVLMRLGRTGVPARRR